MSKLENRRDSGHDIRTLHDDEVDAIAGAKGISFFEALARAWGEALDKQAQALG